MKKVIAFLLAVMMLVPTMAFADETTSEEFEKVLIEVKSKIEVPAELSEFENYMSKSKERTSYEFYWSSPDYEKSINVSADGDGNIKNYRDYSKKGSDKNISPLSKKEIVDFAEGFIKKSIPEMYTDSTDVLMLDEESYSAEGAHRYNLTFERKKNSVLVKNNFVHLTVSLTEDDVPFVYSMNVNLDLETPFAKRNGEIENFVQTYKEKFPVELVFINEYNPDWKKKGRNKYNGALIYRMENNNAGFISLETGEIITEDMDDNIIFREESAGGVLMDSINKSESPLTPEELKEITAVEGLMSVEEIEAKLKKLPYIKFPEDFNLENSRLSKNDEGRYIYNLDYLSEGKDNYFYLDMSVYADDGKLISLYQDIYQDDSKDDTDEISLTEAQIETARQNTEKFLTAAAEEFEETRFQESEEINEYVNFYYYRRIEGVKHATEGIRVTYDTEKNIIASYSLNFTQTGFPSPQTAILDTLAYDKLTEYSPIIKMYVKSGGEYVLCATLKEKGVTVDAYTGEIKNPNKKNISTFTYDDIKGHWVEEAATKLGEMQTGFEGGKLNPDKKITQEDFLRFVGSGLYGKSCLTYETDELYDLFIREGIITEDEKNPTANITREDAFVFVIRMVRLDGIAKLENIFKVDYADGDLISEGKIGYCALLSGMEVICGDGGYLRPQDDLTRAEAVMILYKYLLAA